MTLFTRNPTFVILHLKLKENHRVTLVLSRSFGYYSEEGQLLLNSALKIRNLCF